MGIAGNAKLVRTCKTPYSVWLLSEGLINNFRL
jgi:hypothetical protein